MSEAKQIPPQINHQPLPGVERVIAIASGKGGVGKSTTTVMLAHALASLGQPVAILDADIYGPSIPRMLGLSGQPEIRDGHMLPPQNHGIACNSMGFLVAEEQAAVWRGPMVSKALNQLARGTHWSEVRGQGSEVRGQEKENNPTSDIRHPTSVKLLVDFPPGTGDVQLSMAQQTPLSGAIIVTTPQAVAVADARKCANMFEKMQIPVLGIIENMS